MKIQLAHDSVKHHGNVCWNRNDINLHIDNTATQKLILRHKVKVHKHIHIDNTHTCTVIDTIHMITHILYKHINNVLYTRFFLN